MLDVRIRGGSIVDGTGAAGRQGDLGIRAGRIAAVGRVAVAGDVDVDEGHLEFGVRNDDALLWMGWLKRDRRRVAVATGDTAGGTSRPGVAWQPGGGGGTASASKSAVIFWRRRAGGPGAVTAAIRAVVIRRRPAPAGWAGRQSRLSRR